MEKKLCVGELAEKVVDVIEDQATHGQLINLIEAKVRFPNFVAASLGANRKDKPGDVVTARVLFDGTHGLEVNTRESETKNADLLRPEARDTRERAP